MRALTLIPGQSHSLTLQEIDQPDCSLGHLLVRCLDLGICGTDIEIAAGNYGWAPEGKQYLVIGHEALGEVISAPDDSGFQAGDLVVGFVRRPDPVPCPNCAAGEWDMCSNGEYIERGIKSIDGYGSEQFVLASAYAIKLPSEMRTTGVLVEPASIVAKAWEQIRRIGARATWQPKCALVTGAGPVGLLAALMGEQQGFDMHVFDQVETGPKPDLVRALGATYHSGKLKELDLQPDIIIECTGAAPVILDVFALNGRNGIVCLAGLSSGRHAVDFDIGEIGRRLVLENDLIFGTVNANRRHYEQAMAALRTADRQWLQRLITRRVPLPQWPAAFERQSGDIKVVIDFTG